MSEHPILRYVTTEARAYPGTPGVPDGTMPARLRTVSGETIDGFVSAYPEEGLLYVSRIRHPEGVAEVPTVVVPEYVVTVSHLEDWPGADEEVTR